MKITFNFEKQNVKLGIENQFTIQEFIEHTPVKILMLKGEKGDTVSAEWGTITGDLSSQTDLNTALSGKADKSTTYTKTEVDNAIPDVSNFIDKDVNNLTNYTKSSDLSDVATSGDYEDLTNTPTIPDVSNFITKDVNNLTNYTKTSDLSTVATSGSYNDLDNKPTIPSKVSDLTNDTGFITNKEDQTIYANEFKNKNLIILDMLSFDKNGLTFRCDRTGLITINGTATEQTDFDLSGPSKTSIRPGYYTLSNNYISGTTTNSLRVYLQDHTQGYSGIDNELTQSNTSETRRFSTTHTFSLFLIRVPSGTTLNNYKCQIMLEPGDKATDYVQFKRVENQYLPLLVSYTSTGAGFEFTFEDLQPVEHAYLIVASKDGSDGTFGGIWFMRTGGICSTVTQTHTTVNTTLSAVITNNTVKCTFSGQGNYSRVAIYRVL